MLILLKNLIKCTNVKSLLITNRVEIQFHNINKVIFDYLFNHLQVFPFLQKLHVNVFIEQVIKRFDFIRQQMLAVMVF